MSETLRPRGQRVLVEERDSLTCETKSGIVVQRYEARKVCSGVVLAVGENCPNVEVGDVVHYRRDCGIPWRDKLLLKYDMLEAVGDVEVLAL
jgi:co-chaperonin GroES (HSP10)